MQLRYSPTSPYVRKVWVMALETGLDGQIERIVTDPWAKDTDLPDQNPLGKVPTLILEGGEVLYDSPVICEYLDTLHEHPKLFPDDRLHRWQVLRQQALCDGILDAAVLRRLEYLRPEALRSTDWIALQEATVRRAVEALERESRDWGEVLSIGHIAAGCALSYLDFRWEEFPWREHHPRLADWYAHFERRPSMQASGPPKG